MIDVYNFLSENPTVYLATVDHTGKPRVRPFRITLLRNRGAFFCTSTKRGAYADLSANPFAEISVVNRKNEWVRISATVAFTDSTELKKAVLSKNRMARHLFSSPDNPDLALFYLKEGTATLYTGYFKAPKHVTFSASDHPSDPK